ncbi:MAG: hypothetical protein Q7N50_11990 [Armatimonadota bacterium]|nr:hypothetical protein [Armatimonadota bacterium]
MRIAAHVLTVIGLLCLVSGMVWSTPSTTYWTPATLDIQPVGLTHVTYDTYTTIGKDPGEDFPTTYGLTWGAKLGSKLAAEFGFDYLAPSSDPWLLNAKVGYPENTLSANAPAVQVGFFNFGSLKQNIVDLLIGKSLPNGQGRLTAAYYAGSSSELRSSSGEKENTGFMLAYDRVIIPDKVIFAADYASGDNAIGGGGVGLYYYFNKSTSLLVGPVWFNDKGINGDMKWTVQLDINF